MSAQNSVRMQYLWLINKEYLSNFSLLDFKTSLLLFISYDTDDYFHQFFSLLKKNMILFFPKTN